MGKGRTDGRRRLEDGRMKEWMDEREDGLEGGRWLAGWLETWGKRWEEAEKTNQLANKPRGNVGG